MAGATGAIGKPLVAQLIAAGNEVTGMTRLEERAEAVVHQLTDLPHEFSARYGYGATSELRTRTSSRNAALPAWPDASSRLAGARRTWLVARPVGA